MADKIIGDLAAAKEIYDDSLLVMEQQGEARSVEGRLLKEYAAAAAKEQAETARGHADAAGASADTAAESARDAADIALHPPILKEENDHWWIWDTDLNDYADSGVDAGVSLTLSPETVTGEPGTEAKVENLGTRTDPVLRFTLPRGEKGVSPTVDISKEGGAATITITDAEGLHTAVIRDGDVSREALDAALAGKADRSDTDPVVAWHSNQNVLDNGYFIKPVNQRGQLEYTGSGYAIDRWALAGPAKLTITDTGVHVIQTSEAVYVDFYQTLEAGTISVGETYTLSALMGDGTFYTNTAVVGSGHGPMCQFLNDAGYVSYWRPDNRVMFRTNFTGFTVQAVKLERGSQQTLAHKEGDKWVLNEIPDYGMELLKCQRYFQVFKTADKRPTEAEDFRPTMRIKPVLSTISAGGTTYYAADANL